MVHQMGNQQMNKISILLVEDRPEERSFPVLLFCFALHFLQPVESWPETKDDEETAHFYTHGLWQAHSPAPLGVNRQQFWGLLDDIRKGKTYTCHLSANRPWSSRKNISGRLRLYMAQDA